MKFTEAVTGTAAGLNLTGRNGALAISAFSGSGTNTLAWTPGTPITLSKVTAALVDQGANDLRDAAGNLLRADASGPNYSNTLFAMYVVYGDVTGDKMVTALDRALLPGKYTSATVAYDAFYDVNGDGVVDSRDLAIVNTRVGTGLV